MGVCIAKKLRHLAKKELLAGLVLGALMYFAYITQTIGLKYTTAGKNAFLTAVYVALVPFMMWAARHIRPDRYNVIAAVLCLRWHVVLLSLEGDFSMNYGDMLTLVCSVLYGLHIVAVSFFAGSLDVMRITWLQFLFSALFAWCSGGLFETFPTGWTGGMYVFRCVLGHFCHAGGLHDDERWHKTCGAFACVVVDEYGSVFRLPFRRGAAGRAAGLAHGHRRGVDFGCHGDFGNKTQLFEK